MSDTGMTRRESIVATLLLGTLGPRALAQETTKTTLENLQAAFDGESNAQARYTAFAAKADEEGYHQVASLFRAAARSEGFHARNHANVIRRMGAEPKAILKTPQVKSTKENLESARKGEDYERLTMYPAFINQAKSEKNVDAVQTFQYALASETQHAKYYAEALENLDSWKNGAKEFLVCTNCGYTTTDLALEHCPICYFPRSKIELVK